MLVSRNVAEISSRRECSRWHVLVVTVLGWCWLPRRKILPLFYPIKSQCVHLHIIPSWSSHAIASDAPSAYLLIQLHHTGSQEKVPVAVQEEQAESDPQEIQAQEVPEVEEQGEDMPECVDHQPSFFEQDKLRSILSLLLYKSNSLYIWVLYIVVLSYRSWVKLLMHLLLSLPTLWYSYLNRFRIEYCLALLRPVAIGDFRSPAIIGGYWNTLAMKWMISWR
jgi:hypothetical protein